MDYEGAIENDVIRLLGYHIAYYTVGLYNYVKRQYCCLQSSKPPTFVKLIMITTDVTISHK